MTRTSYFGFLLSLCVVHLFGQAQSGTVVGTVKDQAGAVVPAAAVTLTNESTQFTRTALTNVGANTWPHHFRRDALP